MVPFWTGDVHNNHDLEQAKSFDITYLASSFEDDEIVMPLLK